MFKVGIGVDMVSVSDLKDRMKRNPALVRYIFTDAEQEFCNLHHDRAECYAARFAAKEAFYKALPPPIQDQTSWDDIEVISSSNGKPEIHISEKLLKLLKHVNGGPVCLSITHEGGFAIAFVVVSGFGMALGIDEKSLSPDNDS